MVLDPGLQERLAVRCSANLCKVLTLAKIDIIDSSARLPQLVCFILHNCLVVTTAWQEA